jgi:hypothetical protein
MVKGLNLFRDHFKHFQDSYTLIGGVACYLALDEVGLDFRATKDLDIVLCAEALDDAFVEQFWEFVRAGGYQNQQKSTGDRQFYRFDKPSEEGYPAMLELFSRVPDQLSIPDGVELTPVPVDSELSSLSAILLDDDYYQCIEGGRSVIDGIAVLGPEYILPFKAKAWLDLCERKRSGQEIDSKTIKKHRNDIFRLYAVLSTESRVDIAESIKADLGQFLEAMSEEQGLNLKDFGLGGATLETVSADLRAIYQLGASALA